MKQTSVESVYYFWVPRRSCVASVQLML